MIRKKARMFILKDENVVCEEDLEEKRRPDADENRPLLQ